jgi:hypothetical protein
MGLAGSLHCAGVCGGIAASLLLATSLATTQASRSTALLMTQIGRTTSYTLCGALVGGGGAAFANLLLLANAQPVLRVASVPYRLDRLLGRGSRSRLFRARPHDDDHRSDGSDDDAIPSPGRASDRHGYAGGFAPCGMVYAAMLNAMMIGSAAQGAQFMAGFGLGTILAVASAVLGVSAMAVHGLRLQARTTLRHVLGISMVALGSSASRSRHRRSHCFASDDKSRASANGVFCQFTCRRKGPA